MNWKLFWVIFGFVRPILLAFLGVFLIMNDELVLGCILVLFAFVDLHQNRLRRIENRIDELEKGVSL